MAKDNSNGRIEEIHDSETSVVTQNGKRLADSSDDEPDGKRRRVDESEFKQRKWKDVYKDRWEVGYNWKVGRCTVHTLRGHTNGVTCLQLDDHILATGSYDATIKICMSSCLLWLVSHVLTSCREYRNRGRNPNASRAHTGHPRLAV